jgi:hypothetical protein
MPVKSTSKETLIETMLVARVRAAGGVCEKTTVIGYRGFFDRLIVLPGGRIIFAECKRPRGGRVSAHQKQWHRTLRALGATVAVVKNLDDIERLIWGDKK